MKQLSLFLLIFLAFTQQPSFSTIRDFSTSETKQQIPLTVSIRSIKDLRIKVGQHIYIGQIIAPKPLENTADVVFISQAPFRQVVQQKELIKELEKIKQHNELPEIILEHEQAILKELEFKASEHKARHSLPKPRLERFYKSSINGRVQSITPLSSSDGLLSVELLVQLD